jgi:quinol monooxygenase YgiN
MIVQPERRSDLLETMRGMLEPARVERGCLSYRLYENVEDRNAFVLLEEWATQEDIERHISKDNNRRLLATTSGDLAPRILSISCKVVDVGCRRKKS